MNNENTEKLFTNKKNEIHFIAYVNLGNDINLFVFKNCYVKFKMICNKNMY